MSFDILMKLMLLVLYVPFPTVNAPMHICLCFSFSRALYFSYGEHFSSISSVDIPHNFHLSFTYVLMSHLSTCSNHYLSVCCLHCLSYSQYSSLSIIFSTFFTIYHILNIVYRILNIFHKEHNSIPLR